MVLDLVGWLVVFEEVDAGWCHPARLLQNPLVAVAHLPVPPRVASLVDQSEV